MPDFDCNNETAMASENIDYKALYELVKIENNKLVDLNIELTKELDKYKTRYFKTSSYAEDMELILEEVKTQRKKRSNY